MTAHARPVLGFDTSRRRGTYPHLPWEFRAAPLPICDDAATFDELIAPRELRGNVASAFSHLMATRQARHVLRRMPTGAAPRRNLSTPRRLERHGYSWSERACYETLQALALPRCEWARNSAGRAEPLCQGREFLGDVDLANAA